MISENDQVEATRVDSRSNSDRSDGQLIEHNQSQVPSNGEASTSATASEQQDAASTLLQLQNRVSSDAPHSGDFTRARANIGPGRLNGYGNNSAYDSRSYDNTSSTSRTIVSRPENMNMTQNAYMYSQINMQNTIAGLTSAIGNLQQEHLNMHTRQDSITGTLEQVLSALYTIKDSNHTSASSQVNASSTCNIHSATPTVNSSIDGRCRSYSATDQTNRGLRSVGEYQNGTVHNVSGIDGHTGSHSDTVQTNRGLWSYDESHNGTIHNISSIDSHSRPISSTDQTDRGTWSSGEFQNGNTHNISSADGYSRYYGDTESTHRGPISSGEFQNDTTQSVISSIDGAPHAHEVSHPEVDRVYQVSRFGSVSDNTGFSQAKTDYNQRYNGHLNASRRQRVSFYEPSRYNETRNQLNAHDNHNFSRAHSTLRRSQPTPDNYSVKIPPFNGKEDWKTWINRFEAIAERGNWSDESKLDNLLPKLQGKAGEFVFTQLTRESLGCYRELIQELNSRFRVVETEKSFAAKFSQRAQRTDETVEEFAADLKRLYAKAYKNRDNKTKREDLVRRFLDGMRDNEARFEIEYHKEPDDIDEAVYHAVNFIHTRRRNFHESHEKRFKKYARRTSLEYDGSSDEEEAYETAVEDNRALRIPAKTDKPPLKKPNKTSQQVEQTDSNATCQNDSTKVLMETRDLIQTLVSQLKDQVSSKASKNNQHQENAGFSRRGKVQCYGCGEYGHFARDCPSKSDRPGRNNQNFRGNAPSKQQGQQQTVNNPLN